MGRYRKVDTRIWNDAKFRSMSDDGKLAFLFLLTHPHLTSLGAMRATIPGLAAELGWENERLSGSLREGFRKGIVKHDPNSSFVWVCNFLKYNGPESPNVVKSWSSSIDLIPECSLKVELLQQVKAFTEGLGEGFRKALPKAFAKGMPNPEQEQEQEQEIKEPSKEGSSASTESKPKAEFWFPVRNGFWDLPERKLGEYLATYSDCLDVKTELVKARQWLVDNKAKRKTKQGMAKFLTGWLNRASDKVASAGNGHLDTSFKLPGEE